MNTQFKMLMRFVLAGALCATGVLNAQVTVSDNFTGAAAALPWVPYGDACMTAGNSTGTIAKCTPTSSTSGTGEGGYGAGPCANGTTYASGCINNSQADPVGNGALRLTFSQPNSVGAIIDTTPFASTAGISITFNATAYDGNSGGNGDGSDGISFFLLDAAVPTASVNIGSWGGSIGYSCSNTNTPYLGSTSGYVGLAIDEKGDFLNSNDNTATGVGLPTNGVGPTLSGYVPGNPSTTGNSNTLLQHAQSISMRGRGQVNWYQLNQNFPSFYPSSANVAANIQNTCITGTVWNYSGSTVTGVKTGNVSGASFTGKITSNTTLTVSSIASGSIAVGGLLSGSNVVAGQSICAVVTSGSVYTLCTSQSNVSSESMTLSSCPTGSSSCGSTVGDVANGANMNCAVMVSNSPVTYAQLSAANSTYYPSSLTTNQQTAAVVSTCETGTLWNYSTPASPVNTWTLVSNVAGNAGFVANSQTLYDYVPLPNANIQLPGGNLSINGATQTPPANTSTLLAYEAAGARGNATMRTYNLKITSSGLLTLTYAVDSATTGVPGTAVPVLTNSPIFAANGPLPANFIFGFAASTGGNDNIHEITCFQASPADTSDSSAGVNVVQTGQVKTGTQIYLAFYHANGWWGQLTSQNLVYNSTTNSLVVQSNANWDGSCTLTGDTPGITLPAISESTLPGGGICQATYLSGTNAGNTDTAEVPDPYSTAGRQIFTYNGSNGIPFEWTSLSAAQQTALTGTDTTTTAQNRLNYLRGDRSNEVLVNSTTGAVSGVFRTRISVLGDIVDSSPTWVGAPLQLYPSGAGAPLTAWQDSLNTSVTMPENTNTYGTFQSTYANRLNMVFAGANDGMLHGFEAGAFDNTGAFYSGYNDGREVFAYMPNAVLNVIHNSSNASLDYSSPNFAHNFYVDATPDIDDVYFGGAWHTWLVSGLGAGGNALFALDITNPATAATTNTAASPRTPAFPESAAGATSLVLGEWNTSTAGLGNNLGQTYGTPQVKRLHSGNWAIIFGNGYNAPNYNGGIFVGIINQTTGAVTFEFLPLPASANGTAANPNGIFYASLVDLDGDSIVDYIYAGDLYGNVWRWDVTQTTQNPSPSAWAAAVPAPILLFTTPGGMQQPITTQVQIVLTPGTSSRRRLMVDFGTGEQLNAPTATTYAIGQQALFGIWDGNMNSWNSKSGVTIDNQFVSFPSTSTTSGGTTTYTATTSGLTSYNTTTVGTNVYTNYTVSAAHLETQADTSATGVNYRVVSSNAVCWASTASCSSSAQYGWLFDFPLPAGMSTATAAVSALEQVVFNPAVQEGAFVVNTYVPATNQACTTINPSGWTMALNPASGGAFTTSFFGTSSSGFGSGSTATNIVVSGLQLGASGSPSFVVADSVSYLLTQTLSAPAPGSAGSASAAAALAKAQANLAAAQATFAADTAAGASSATLAADAAAVAAAQAAVAAAQAAAGPSINGINNSSGTGYRLNWTEIR